MPVLLSQASICLVFTITVFIIFLNSLLWIRINGKIEEVHENDSVSQCTKCYDYARMNPDESIYYADCACSLEDCSQYCGQEMHAINNCTIYQRVNGSYETIGWKYEWDTHPTLDQYRCNAMPVLQNLQCFGGFVSAKDDTFDFKVVAGCFTAWSILALIIVWIVFFVENSMSWNYQMRKAEHVSTWTSLITWMVAFLALTEIYNSRLTDLRYEEEDISCYTLAIPENLNDILYLSYGFSFIMFWLFFGSMVAYFLSVFCAKMEEKEEAKKGMLLYVLFTNIGIMLLSILIVLLESVVTLYYLQKEDLFILLLLGIINFVFAFLPPIVFFPRKSHAVTVEDYCDACFRRRLFYDGQYFE